METGNSVTFDGSGRDRRAGPTIGITSPLRGRFRGSSRDGWDDHVATSMSLCDPIL